jgi:hypothetical protein
MTRARPGEAAASLSRLWQDLAGCLPGPEAILVVLAAAEGGDQVAHE